MPITPRLRLVTLLAVLAAGAALFAAAVSGMTRMDADLASAVAPPPVTRFVSHEARLGDCPERLPVPAGLAPDPRPEV